MKKLFVLTLFTILLSAVHVNAQQATDSVAIAKSQQHIDANLKAANKHQRKIEKRQKRIEKQQRRLNRQERKREKRMKSVEKEQKKIEKATDNNQ